MAALFDELTQHGGFAMRKLSTKRTAAAAFVLGAALLTPAQVGISAANAATQPYVVLSISQSGGFVPWQWAQMRTPDAVLYSDGTLLANQPVMTAVYPGPAAPSILRKMSTMSIPRILAAADAARVTNPKFDWGMPWVADVPNTDFVTQRSAKGPSTLVSIYAVGFSGPGLTKEQSAARSAASDFASKVQSFHGTLVPTKSMPTRWVSPRWSYVAQPAAADEFSVVRPWFGAKPLAESMSCVDFSAAENRKLIALLPKLNQASRWRSGNQTWQVSLRPLFPHETGCAAVR